VDENQHTPPVSGAGLDMRAFRLGWPCGTRLFELDTAGVHGFKDQVIAAAGWRPRCERIAVRAGLRGDWPAALLGAGLRPGEPAAWLAEGLLRYLGPAEGERLVAGVTGLSAAGSELAVESASPATAGRAARSRATNRRTTPSSRRSRARRPARTDADPRAASPKNRSAASEVRRRPGLTTCRRGRQPRLPG